jgi:hypothetical protein
MQRLLRFSLLLLGLLWTTATFAGPSDGDLFVSLVGSWREARALECESHEQRIDLGKDGTFRIAGNATFCDAPSISFVVEGIWAVQSGYFTYAATTSSPSDLMPAGQQFNDQIVSVTATDWLMIEESTGHESHAVRLP